MYVAHIPGWPGAHTQGESLDELQSNLREVVALLLEDGEPKLETEFIGTQTVVLS
jgi:predicted RNase H-like HicB family nuclease